MRPKTEDPLPADDLFRSRLDQIINLRHELVRLAHRIDWTYLDQQAAPFYAEQGRPAIPTRLMVGLHLLKHMYALSDDGVCERWVYDPYFQYFCGENHFQHDFPIERSSMTHWRKRLGEEFCQKLIQESLRVAFEAKAVSKRELQKVVVDTTVQPKAITFPTDAKLRFRALIALVRLARKHQVILRQSYVRVAKRALVMSGRYRHAKQLKRARRAERYLQVRLGRVMRDVRRHIQDNDSLQALFADPLHKASIIYRQHKDAAEKLYSWHATETECIGKGKADKPYEFGCKVSIATTVHPGKAGHFVLHAKALHGRPFDGHTLKPVIAELTQWSGIEPQRLFVDKGYRGHDYEHPHRVYRSGQRRGVTAAIKKELKRRSVIEPVIGHLKNEGHLGRNYLKGEQGDRLNVLLAAAGYNFRLLLRWLRRLFGLDVEAIIQQFLSVHRARFAIISPKGAF
jgi:transposase, IS5 family